MNLDDLELSVDDQRRVREFIDASQAALQQIHDCNEHIKDHAKSLAEHIGVKPALLIRAAKVAFKASMAEEKAKISQVETILAAAGRA